MARFTVRTTAPDKNNSYYKFGVATEGQCTWGVYYRTSEMGFTPPCYWDRATRSGSYTNAKNWPENYREPWEVKPTDYDPIPGDIIVFNGTYGHVAIIEDYAEGDNNFLISHWNRDSDGVYHSQIWHKNDIIKGAVYNTGKVKNYMHYSDSIIEPVAKDTTVNQIEVIAAEQRLRKGPSTSFDILGYCPIGFYNVIDIVKQSDYDWYKLADDIYIAGVGNRIKFYSAETASIDELIKENAELKAAIKQINEIVSKLI